MLRSFLFGHATSTKDDRMKIPMDISGFVVICILILNHSTIGYAADIIINNNNDAPGCHHNGSMYANGSLVPTMESCLNCKCINKNLICSLRVCAEQPMPPPRGCVLVHKRNVCCSYLVCNKLHKGQENQQHNRHRDDRYKINHNNIVDDAKETPPRILSDIAAYRHIDDDEEYGNAHACIYNGTIYKSGSAMSSSTLCSYCYCIGGKQKCVKPKCLLASDGCEPVFSDSACCPIRYVCGDKAKGKPLFVSKESDRKKLTNKHYLRSAARNQRSSGCVIKSTFYLEGQKLPIDPTSPCDICFCIRGSKKCTPKKCTPAIRNCKPMIPAGQCCPASYDCKHTSNELTPRALQSTSRQFDLFSLLFGGDESPTNATAEDDVPVTDSSTSSLSSGTTTSEKSFFDAIRDGLNYIDSNDQHLEAILNKSATTTSTILPMTNQTITVQYGPSSPMPEFSFLDLLLGDEDESPVSDTALDNVDYFESTTFGETNYGAEKPTPTEIKVNIITADPYGGTNTEINEELGKPAVHVFPSLVNDYENKTEIISAITATDNSITNKNTDETDFASTTTILENTSLGTTSTEGSSTIEDLKTTSEMTEHTDVTKENQQGLQSIVTSATMEVSTIGSNSPAKENDNITIMDNAPQTTPTPKITVNTTSTVPTAETENLFSALFDEFSNIFVESNTNKTHTTKNPNTTTNSLSTTIKISTTTTATTSLPTNATQTEMVPTSSELLNGVSTSTQSIMNISLTTALPDKSIVISSNPSILETDLNYDYGDPTLPPSLPNLKIIPFLPADAVQKDSHNKYSEYYKKPINYPVLTENYDHLYSNDKHTDIEYHGGYRIDPNTDYPPSDVYNLKLENKNGNFNLDSLKTKLDYDQYDHTPVYPSITENYDIDGNHYDYDSYSSLLDKHDKFSEQLKYIQNVYDSSSSLGSNNNGGGSGNNNPYGIGGFEKFATIFTEKNVFDKIPVNPESLFGYEAKNQFSPPSKTEGGFVPREPVPEHFFYENFHTAKPVDSQKNGTSRFKGSSTTADPFKNVIRTEPPPDLHSLIEDKEKLLQNRLKDSLTAHTNEFDDINLDDSDFEKHIISITTDSNYNVSPPEYTAEQSAEYPSSSKILSSASTTTTTTIKPKYSPLTTFDETDDFLESVFGPLFRSDQSDHSNNDDNDAFTTESTNVHNKTIPPFKNITNSLSLMDILNSTRKTGSKHSSSDIPQRINNKIFDPTTELNAITTTMYQSSTQPPPAPAKVDNLNILRDVLLATLNSPPSIAKDSHNKKQNGNIDTPPFLPFLSPIFPGTQSQEIDSFNYAPIRSDLDLIIPELNNNKHYGNNNGADNNDNYSPDSYQVFPEYSSISNIKSYVVNPVNVEQLKQHQYSENNNAYSAASSSTKPSSIKTKNAMGILKLAGCNIYGRMYRVGRIISELSGPCLECKCTEVGVHCTPLHC